MEQVNRSQILRQMRNRQKKMNLPELGNSFNDFKILLDLPEWNELKFHDGSSNINISVYNTGENHVSIAFTDNNNFIKFAECDTFYLLTAKNFDIEPYAVDEIMFVTVVKSNRAYVVLQALIATASDNCYRPILRQIKQTMPNVTMIYANYDRLLHEDCKEEFPDAAIKGTLFSYCNHIVNESLIRFRGVNILRKDEIIQKICALLLLPPEQITICYRKIRESIPHEEQQNYDEFFNLFAEKWMQGVGPVNFSNYNDLKSLQDVQRSTFNIFNNFWFNNKNGRNDIWKILRYNQYVAYGTESNLKKLDEGKDPCNNNCPTSHFIIQGGKPDIEKLWRKFLNNNFDIDYILRCLRFQIMSCYEILNNSDRQRIRCSVMLIDNVQQQALLHEEDNNIVMLDHDYLHLAAVEEVEGHANEDDVIGAHDVGQPLDEAVDLDDADDVIANDVNATDDVDRPLAEAADPDAADAVNSGDLIAAHVVGQPLAEAAHVVADPIAGDLSEDDDQIGINVNDDYDFLADARNDISHLMADIVEGYRRIDELEARGFSNLRYIGNGRVVSVRREDDHEAIEEVEEREDNDENPAHKSRLILERIIARPPYRNDNDEISAKCCVCLENQIAYTFAPCNHFMICQACLVQLLAEADSNLSPGLKCPVCRVFTKKIRHVLFTQ